MGGFKLRITVIGCGYVGLVTGTCFAEAGHQVVCTDNDAERIATLKAGIVPIYEPHLDGLLTANSVNAPNPSKRAGTIAGESPPPPDEMTRGCCPLHF